MVTVYPGSKSFFATGRELNPGTAVVGTRFPPYMKFDPVDDPHILIDEGLRGAMVKEYGAALGKLWATHSFDAALFDDLIGDLLLNIFGDYTSTGTAAAPNSTLTSPLTAGTTTVPVTLGTGFAASQWIQIGPDASGGAEIVQILSVATNTITLQASTPTRFAHANASTVTNTTGPYTHTFSTLNAGSAQPPTHTFVDSTGMTPTTGARAYPFGCLDELTLTGNAEKLLMANGKITSFASAPTGTTPTNAPTSELVQPSWYSTVSIGGSQLNNITEWTWTVKRNLIVKNTANGSQTPYVIGRGDLTGTGKLIFVAADESPLTTYLAGTQQPIVFAIDNSLAGINHRNLTITMTKGLYIKNTLKRDVLFGWETEYAAIGNTTDVGFSAGFSIAKAVLLNNVPSF